MTTDTPSMIDKPKRVCAFDGCEKPIPIGKYCRIHGHQVRATAWYKEHNQYARLRNRQYYAADPEKYKAYQKGLRESRRLVENKHKRLRAVVYGIKHRCTKGNIPFDVEFMFDMCDAAPEQCKCCGKHINYTGERNVDTASFDRVIPAKGYVPGNVNIVCNNCNRIKSDMSITDLEMLLAYISASVPLVQVSNG